MYPYIKTMPVRFITHDPSQLVRHISAHRKEPIGRLVPKTTGGRALSTGSFAPTRGDCSVSTSLLPDWPFPLSRLNDFDCLVEIVLSQRTPSDQARHYRGLPLESVRARYWRPQIRQAPSVESDVRSERCRTSLRCNHFPMGTHYLRGASYARLAGS